MMRYKFLLAVIISILVVLAAYYIVVGNIVAIDDFTQDGNDSDGSDGSDDSNGTDTAHDWDAYATFGITCSVYRFALVSFHGTITSIVPDVQPFEDMATGRVYESKELLQGHEDMYGRIWLDITVRNSQGFKAQWQSGDWFVLGQHTIDDPLIVGLRTGRVFFENPGTYEILVVVNAASVANDIPYRLITSIQTFEVEY